jgi:hypothetical protein
MFKTILENHLKAKAPALDQDLMNECVMVLGDVAHSNNVSKYHLSMLFKVVDKKLIAQVLDEDKKELTAFDAGGLFTEMFQEQMKAVPVELHPEILKHLGGESVEQLLVSMLKEDNLLIRYNQDKKIGLYYLTAEETTATSIKAFIESLKL